eukprot:TRINITY_DN437_c0_g1_i1.p1 TRINITY_DN437_c0_g1~~TRINITY_DN437_c0_g1_i1.p1  ORF type:complete len:273 (-),score=45.81 TRINITY_DN437_c0_g1_i1:98-916(-)
MATASPIPSLNTCSVPSAAARARTFSGFPRNLPGFSLKKDLNSSFKHLENLASRLTTRYRHKNTFCAQVTMMPTSVVRVPHIDPKFGSIQWIDVWNCFYRDRVIFLTEYLTDDLVNQLTATVIYLDYISTAKMWFLVNSPGGDIIPCLTLYDSMHNTSSIPATVCLGFAFNLSVLILAAGEKGERKSMPRAMIQMQPLGGEMHGLADDLYSEAMELRRLKKHVHEQLALKTGHPLEKIEEDFSSTRYFGALEALDYGLIDAVVQGERIMENQ